MGGVLGMLGAVGGGVLNLVAVDLGRTPGGLAAFLPMAAALVAIGVRLLAPPTSDAAAPAAPAMAA